MILENDKLHSCFIFHCSSLHASASFSLFHNEGFAFPKVREKKFFQKAHNLSECGFAHVSNKGSRGWHHACYSQGLQLTFIKVATFLSQVRKRGLGDLLVGTRQKNEDKVKAQTQRLQNKHLCQRPPSCTALYKLVKPTFQDASTD